MADENDWKPGDHEAVILRKILSRLGGGIPVTDSGGGGGGGLTDAELRASPVDVTVTSGGGETNVGGFMASIKDTTAVSASPDYSIGDAIGGKRTLSNAVRVAGTGILQDILVLDRSNQKPSFELFIFDADPTSATITDNSTFDFSTDDVKVIAKVIIGSSDYSTIDTTALAVKAVGQGLKAASGTTLYAAVVATVAWNAATTSDLQIIYKILQD